MFAESIVVGKKALLAPGPLLLKNHCWASLSAEIKASAADLFVWEKPGQQASSPKLAEHRWSVMKVSFGRCYCCSAVCLESNDCLHCCKVTLVLAILEFAKMYHQFFTYTNNITVAFCPLLNRRLTTYEILLS